MAEEVNEVVNESENFDYEKDNINEVVSEDESEDDAVNESKEDDESKVSSDFTISELKDFVDPNPFNSVEEVENFFSEDDKRTSSDKIKNSLLESFETEDVAKTEDATEKNNSKQVYPSLS